MNGGLCAAIVACNTVFVLILAYFMFGEKITKINFIAILFLIASAVLVGLFTPDIQDVLNYSPVVSTGGAEQAIISFITEDELTICKIKLIVGGLVASVSFGSQLLVFKSIMMSTKDTFSIGFGFLFSCGFIGLLSLAVELIRTP